MKNYLKIQHQDGLLEFTGFLKAQVRLHVNTGKQLFDDKPVIDIEIITDEAYKKPHSAFDFIRTASLSLYQYPIAISQFEQLEQLEIDIPDAFAYSQKYNSDLIMYLGYGVAINENKIRFKKINNDYFIFWNAIADDINYYDERAKPNKVELVAKVALINDSKKGKTPTS